MPRSACGGRSHLFRSVLGEQEVKGQGEELVSLLYVSVGDHASPCGLVLALVHRVHLYHAWTHADRPVPQADTSAVANTVKSAVREFYTSAVTDVPGSYECRHTGVTVNVVTDADTGAVPSAVTNTVTCAVTKIVTNTVTSTAIYECRYEVPYECRYNR